MNCDETFTISDVGLWVDWAFFSPGDGVLWWLMQGETLATFLEITPAAYSGWGSGIISGIAWLIAFLVSAAIGAWFE